MSKEAGEIIQKFYLKLRDHNTSADSTPITARQLESLVRLAQARARVDLREEITVQDAMVSQHLQCLVSYICAYMHMSSRFLLLNDETSWHDNFTSTLHCWAGELS